MEQGHLLIYVDSTMREPLSPGPMSRVWLVELPFQAGFYLYSRTHPTFGGRDTRRTQRTTLWSQSLLLPLAGFQDQSFPQLAHQAQSEPSPQPTAGFCLAMGAHAPWGAASQVAGFPVWGDFCLLRIGSRQAWVVCHLC